MNTCKESLRSLVFVFVGLWLLILTAGCGASSKNEVARPAAQPSVKSAAPPAAGAPTASSPKFPSEMRKVIESAQITLETKDLPRIARVIQKYHYFPVLVFCTVRTAHVTWLRLNQPLKTIHMLTVTNVHPEIYIKIVISGDSGQAPLKGRFYN